MFHKGYLPEFPQASGLLNILKGNKYFPINFQQAPVLLSPAFTEVALLTKGF